MEAEAVEDNKLVIVKTKLSERVTYTICLLAACLSAHPNRSIDNQEIVPSQEIRFFLLGSLIP